MGFGLFKKNNTATMVLKNCNVYTESPALPWAEAIAIKDDKIIYVGDETGLDEFIGKETEEIDLDGMYVYPGFIDIHRSPVVKAFHELEEEGFDLDSLSGNAPDESEDEDSIDDVNEGEIESCECGGCEECEAEEEICEEEIPIAEEDFDQIIAKFDSVQDYYSSHGFTSVLNLMSGETIQDMYQDYLMGMMGDTTVKQKYFGSLFVNLPAHPMLVSNVAMRRRTNLLEVDDLNCDFVNILLACDRAPEPFTKDTLSKMIEEAAARGFSLYLECESHADMLMAYQALDELRGSGYKNMVLIASDEELTDDEKSELLYFESAELTWRNDLLSEHAVSEDVEENEDKLYELTVFPAMILGKEKELGVIEKGKIADFTVFKENFLESDIDPEDAQAQMTIMNGEIVFAL